MVLIGKVLDRLELTLNTTKTRIVNSFEENFVFLGFSFQMRHGFRSGKLYPNTEPAKKSLVKIKTEVRALTKRENTSIPMEVLISRLNTSLKGWVNYFHYGNSTFSFRKLRTFVEYRVSSHLGSRHKIRQFKSSLKAFTPNKLYNEHGLYKIPLNAKWKQVHASK